MLYLSLYAICAGQAPQISIYKGLIQLVLIAKAVETPPFHRSPAVEKQYEDEYLKESNRIETVADLFMNTSAVTWKYYDYPIKLGGYATAIRNGHAFDYWNPFSAKASTYTQNYSSHFVNRGQLFQDLKNGSLPQVSWVIPSYKLSEHPPENITLGVN
jgi:phospholipase C